MAGGGQDRAGGTRLQSPHRRHAQRLPDAFQPGALSGGAGEELFGANTPDENVTLKALKNMPVNQRRHATILLIGNSFQTFTPMEAFKNSVHAVINSSEMFLLKQLVEKAVADNSLFLQSYREVQNRIAASGTRA